MAEMLKGLDVSSDNERVDWDAFKQTDAQFAYIRVLKGRTQDDEYAYNWENALRVEMWHGPLHTLEPSVQIEEEVNRFVQYVKDDPGDLPPAVDITKGIRLDDIHYWVHEIGNQLSVRPLIYTSAGIWNGIEDNSGLKPIIVGSADLWVANWQINGIPEYPTLPVDWGSWYFWQYGKGWNYFHGNAQDLQSYAGIQVSTKTATIICNFLRGRAEPKYVAGQSEVIFSKGQVLRATGAEDVFEAASGITWMQVEVPSCPCCRLWISSHPTYVRVEESMQ